jgi:hypothetical protein
VKFDEKKHKQQRAKQEMNVRAGLIFEGEAGAGTLARKEGETRRFCDVCSFVQG